jgi:hypothetical protein
LQVPPKRNELRENLMLAIPTFFDLVATILMNVGLLYVTASVYQMMRGAGKTYGAVCTWRIPQTNNKLPHLDCASECSFDTFDEFL